MIDWIEIKKDGMPELELDYLVYFEDRDYYALAKYQMELNRFVSASFHGIQPTHWACLNTPSLRDSTKKEFDRMAMVIGKIETIIDTFRRKEKENGRG